MERITVHSYDVKLGNYAFGMVNLEPKTEFDEWIEVIKKEMYVKTDILSDMSIFYDEPRTCGKLELFAEAGSASESFAKEYGITFKPVEYKVVSIESDCIRTVKCKYCDFSKNSYTHTLQTIPVKAPTCTNTGLTEGKKCTVCNTITVKQNPVPATGKHTGGKATCKSPAVCTVCKKPYGTVNKNNHTSIINLPAKAATYKATGLTAGKKCKGCNTVTLKQNTVPVKKLSQVTGIKATPDATSLSLRWNRVTGAEKYEIRYIGGGRTLTKTVMGSSVSLTSLKSGTTYTVKVKAVSGTNKGAEGTLTVSTKPSKAKIKSAKSSKKRLASIVWGKVTGATGYQVQYSTSKKFTKKTTKTTKSTKLTVKKLKSRKKYYVRVRAYRVVKGEKIYGSWSSTKTVKIK